MLTLVALTTVGVDTVEALILSIELGVLVVGARVVAARVVIEPLSKNHQNAITRVKAIQVIQCETKRDAHLYSNHVIELI